MNIFLDDIRNPKDAIGLVDDRLNRFYWESEWQVVRNYEEFVDFITKNGIPDFISFDHDLADQHYNNDNDYSGYTEKTGYEAAKWLVDYCLENECKIPCYIVHSANPVGKLNIESYLSNAEKHLF